MDKAIFLSAPLKLDSVENCLALGVFLCLEFTM